jgi:phosphoglycerate dehydrogenase-like enzyme
MTAQPMTGQGADLNVVVLHQVEDACLADIAAVSPRLKVRVGATAERLEKARRRSILYPPVDLNELLPDADILFAFDLPGNLVPSAPRLKWVQLTSAGVDQAATVGLLATGITITTTSGIHAGPMSEYVMATMLMFEHHFPRALRQQIGHTWKRYSMGELAGKTVGIVGYGHIGKAVGRLALAFGMEVYASQRSVAEPSTISVEGWAVHLLPASHLHHLLAQSDFVVLAVPLVQDTSHLIGEAELAAMKPSSFLVNISRGSVVDEPALLKALQEGGIAGAALDVFDTEPLPANSPLWDLENVILTPHSAGISEDYNARATAIFCDNLARYLAGEPLVNLVDKKRGY